MEYKNSNGMSWLIIQILREIIESGGGNTYRKIILTFLFSDCIYAMTVKYPKAQQRANEQRELLKTILEEYQPRLDTDEYSVADKIRFEMQSDSIMRDLLCVANEYNLINPDAMGDLKAPSWASVKAGEFKK
jgi:hypothetical protein